MNRHVLDANALMALLEERPGADAVQQLLIAAAGTEPLLMSAVNWGEVYYSIWLARGQGIAEEKLSEISKLPIEVRDVDQLTAKTAARFKALYKLPYADCFAAALAEQERATLVTGDADFSRIQDEVAILWLPAKD